MPHHRILIVDDEDSVLKGWRKALRYAGYSVTAVQSSGGALAACDEHAFDVIVIDFLMPSMNGVELLRRLRQKLPMVRTGRRKAPRARSRSQFVGSTTSRFLRE